MLLNGVGISECWCEALSAVPGATVAAVSTSGHNGDADLDRAKDFAAKWGMDECVAYNSYDDLVTNPNIDIVYSKSAQRTTAPLHVVHLEPPCMMSWHGFVVQSAPRRRTTAHTRCFPSYVYTKSYLYDNLQPPLPSRNPS